MSQLHTSSGKYSLDAVFFNESISDWVKTIHMEVSKLYGMKKIKIKPRDYGYDSYTYVLSEILSIVTTQDIMNSIQNNCDTAKFIERAHAAWIDNYLFWKSKRADELTDDPTKTINTIDRNDRATTNVKNLNKTDLEMYSDIINIVFKILTKKIIEAGMQNLSIH